MRVLSASIAVSSIILGGWLSGAIAQNVIGTAGLNTTSQEPPLDSGNPPVGVIPQPSIESPGLIVGITLGELYTDNLRLAATGKPKQASWITEIQPFIKWAGSTPRFSGVLNYSMSGYLYAGQSRYNQVAHDLHALGTLTILPQHLFLDGTLSYRQAIINNELPAGSGTFFLTNNRANVAIGTLGPYWTQDLGEAGTMLLRYTVGRVLYNDHGISGQNASLLNGIPDITSKALQFSLTSPEYQTWGWNLGYSDQRIERDFGQDIHYAIVKLGASWQINNSTKLLADVGKENKFLPNGATKKLGAGFWDAGFNWSNTRDNLRLLVGHRFYGHSYELSWNHTAALLSTTVSYVERPTDLNQQLLGQNPGQIVLSPVGISYIPSLRQRQVYLMKRAMGSATYTMPAGSLRVTLYDERRTYLTLDNSQEKVANANIDWLFNIGPFTTLTPTLGWQRYQFQDSQVQNKTYGQLALVHQFNPKDFGSVRLRHDSRNVNSSLIMPGSRGYRVNVVFVQWTHLF
jgi:hypothetical protein